MFDTYIKWIEAHERLLLVAVAGVVLWFGIGRVDSLIARHDNANLQQAQVIAQVQQEKTAAIAAQVAEQAAQYQALADKVQVQNAALVQANTELATALAKQQRTDASLPPTELVNRWSTLVPQAKPTVTPSGVALDTPSAVATVQALEAVPVLTAQVSNTQKELDNAQSLVTAEGQQVVTLNTEVGSLRTQLGDNQAVCQAQIAVVRAEVRKSKRRWFYAGVVVGFVGRQILKTYTGM